MKLSPTAGRVAVFCFIGITVATNLYVVSVNGVVPKFNAVYLILSAVPLVLISLAAISRKGAIGAALVCSLFVCFSGIAVLFGLCDSRDRLSYLFMPIVAMPLHWLSAAVCVAFWKRRPKSSSGRDPGR